MSKANVTKKEECMENENLIYIIGYSDGAETGYLGYDNNPCNSLDYAMSFSTRLEAKNNLNALQSEWKSELSIIEVPKAWLRAIEPEVR